MEDIIHLTADRFPLVRDIGWNQAGELYTHPDRMLDYDVFIYVTEGEMQVIEEGNEYVVRRGEHLFLKKGLHHWGLPLTPPGTSWYWVHFNTTAGGRSSYKEHIPLPELGFYYPHYYEYRFALPKHGTSPFHLTLEGRLKLLLEESRRLKEHWMTISSLRVYELFIELDASWRAERQAAAGNTNHRGSIAVRVMAFLADHCREDIASEELSRYMKMNYSYLSAAFKAQTGQTINETHTKLRINQAVQLMRDTPLNISEISEALGYPNPYYFSRVFKKVLGEAPSVYLRQLYRS